jgi:hypothetical protein
MGKEILQSLDLPIRKYRWILEGKICPYILEKNLVTLPNLNGSKMDSINLSFWSFRLVHDPCW